MNREFPIRTAVRFLWRDSAGALRLGVGMTHRIGRSSVCIQAQDIPACGTRVQVIVDMPRVRADVRPGRLMGEGVAVSLEQAYGQPTGFAAEVRFQSNWACRPALNCDHVFSRWDKVVSPVTQSERVAQPIDQNRLDAGLFL